MSKIYSLFLNEITKIIKKVSILVILILIVVLTLGYGALMKFSLSMIENQSGQLDTSSYQKDNSDKNLSQLKSDLDGLKQKLASAKEEDKPNIEFQITDIENQIKINELASQKGINLYEDTYLSKTLSAIAQNDTTLSELKKIPAESLTDVQKKQIETCEKAATTLMSIIDNKDFNAYYNYKNDTINSDTTLTEGQKKIHLEANDLRKKIMLNNPGSKQISSGIEGMIDRVTSLRLTLLNGIDYLSGTPIMLTADKATQYKNEAAITTYKLENNMISNKDISGMPLDTTYSVVAEGISGIGIFLVMLLVIILAGGTISSEISTGSIKSLIIAPVKRYKIYTAKILAIFTVGVAAILITFGISVLTNQIMFGEHVVKPFVTATNGNVYEINYYLYQLAVVFINSIKIFIYMLFALIISTVTRNTALAVGLSIGLYFCESIVLAIVYQFASGEWVKFIPFSNFSLKEKIFPSTDLAQVAATASGSYTPSLTFSVVYIIVFVICLGYIGYDSFNRRDIK